MTLLTATEENIARAGSLIKDGGLVAFPTETVYGLGANALDATAVAKIFAAKKRPSFDPLIVHLANAADLEQVARVDGNAKVQKLIDHLWPGPLTLVLPKQNTIPGLVTSGLDTVGVRVPSHAVAQQLIAAAGVPIAAPSANTFGQLSPTRAQHVVDDLGDSVDIILDGGGTTWGVESTIVAVEGDKVSILRLGAVPVERIEDLVGSVEVLSTHVADNEAASGPGQLAQHYSPYTKLLMIKRGEAFERTDHTVYLAFNAPPPEIDDAIAVRILSPGADLNEAAAHLFDVLHVIDKLGASQIVAEWMPERGLGRAMNDRLRRASAKFK